MKRVCLILIYSVVLLLLFLVSPSISKGQELVTPKVYFSEIMWQGSSSSFSDKWIELYNDSNDLVDLGDFSLYNGSCGQTGELILKIPPGKKIAPGGYFLLSHNQKDAVYSGGESILNIDPDVVNSALHFDKSKLQISLCDSSDGQIDVIGDGKDFFTKKSGDEGGSSSIFSSAYRTRFDLDKSIDSWDFTFKLPGSGNRKNLDEEDPAATKHSFATPENSGSPKINSVSLIKNTFEIGSNLDLVFSYDVIDSNNDLSQTKVILLKDGREISSKISPFGGKEFSFSGIGDCSSARIFFIDKTGFSSSSDFNLVFYQKSNQIKFYEVLPHPKNTDWNKDGILNTKDEWIELANFSQENIDLSGWYIKDLSGKKFTFSSSQIRAGDFLTLFGSETGISLNDSGETLFLFDPENTLIDTLVIASSTSKEDISFAKYGDNWFWTTTPTPGQINIINQKKETDQLGDQTDEGANITLSGKIIELGRDGFCILSDGKTVAVKLSDGKSDVKIGQTVTVSGVIRNASSPYLVTTSSEVIISPEDANTNSPDASNQINATEGQIIVTRKTTTRRTKLKLSSNSVLMPLVLGSQDTVSSRASNVSRFLLYFMGIFIFLAIILVYDICRRE